jgi:hypothetical protein
LQCVSTMIPGMPIRRDSVDHLVRALGGENDGDEQLEVVAMSERDADIGVGSGQPRRDGAGSLLFILGGLPFYLSGFSSGIIENVRLQQR